MDCRKQAVVPRGFTIVELMIAIVLLAISAALALPSYREMIEKRQLTHGAEQIVAFVNAAQSESIKQNSVLTVSYSRTADDDWCFGAVVGAAACDCNEADVAQPDFCAIDAQTWIIDNSHTSDRDLVTGMEGDGAYSFDPVRGLLTDLDDTLVVELKSVSDMYQLRLSVSSTGQVNLCSPRGDHPVPGYGSCPAEEGEEES